MQKPRHGTAQHCCLLACHVCIAPAARFACCSRSMPASCSKHTILHTSCNRLLVAALLNTVVVASGLYYSHWFVCWVMLLFTLICVLSSQSSLSSLCVVGKLQSCWPVSHTGSCARGTCTRAQGAVATSLQVLEKPVDSDAAISHPSFAAQLQLQLLRNREDATAAAGSSGSAMHTIMRIEQ
jgi:hypothetical protein